MVVRFTGRRNDVDGERVHRSTDLIGHCLLALSVFMFMNPYLSIRICFDNVCFEILRCALKLRVRSQIQFDS